MTEQSGTPTWLRDSGRAWGCVWGPGQHWTGQPQGFLKGWPGSAQTGSRKPGSRREGAAPPPLVGDPSEYPLEERDSHDHAHAGSTHGTLRDYTKTFPDFGRLYATVHMGNAGHTVNNASSYCWLRRQEPLSGSRRVAGLMPPWACRSVPELVGASHGSQSLLVCECVWMGEWEASIVLIKALYKFSVSIFWFTTCIHTDMTYSCRFTFTHKYSAVHNYLNLYSSSLNMK